MEDQRQNRVRTNARKKELMTTRRKIVRRNRIIAITAAAFFIVIIVIAISNGIRNMKGDSGKGGIANMFKKQVTPIEGAAAVFPEFNIQEEFLDINEYSRPGIELEDGVKYIVIHYTANPGSTAEGNRNYFENLKDTGDTYASSHFVIGLDGEIVQCIPLNEMCYASNARNVDSIAIECCHPDETGNFNDATYNNCVYLTAALCDYYDIDTDYVIRHYDITGKECPKYFVDHPDRWEVFLDFVDKYRKK